VLLRARARRRAKKVARLRGDGRRPGRTARGDAEEGGARGADGGAALVRNPLRGGSLADALARLGRGGSGTIGGGLAGGALAGAAAVGGSGWAGQNPLALSPSRRSLSFWASYTPSCSTRRLPDSGHDRGVRARGR
jgi:hypothetical protein